MSRNLFKYCVQVWSSGSGSKFRFSFEAEAEAEAEHAVVQDFQVSGEKKKSEFLDLSPGAKKKFHRH